MLKRELKCALSCDVVNGGIISLYKCLTASRSNRIPKLLAVFGVLMISVLLGSLPLAAQSNESSSDRKVISRVEPEYPDALKRLYIGGVVRVEVDVAPNGVVKSTKLLGGSPILGQSTMKAIKQWRYAPAASEETLTVRLEFDPHR
jgi:TonB family protein